MKKVITGLLAVIVGAAAGAFGVNYLKEKKITEKEQKIEKFKNYYNLLNQWLTLKQDGISIEKYFIDHGYRTIAVYGMGEMGKRLCSELKNSEIEVKYAIDQFAGSTYSEVDIVDMEDELKKVDVIVVTATFAFDEIKEQLEQKTDDPVISLDDVVYEL